MAEGFARYYGGDDVNADSAGTHPVGINAYAKWAMNEAGIDISDQTSDPLEQKNLPQYDHIITLCGDARDNCPTLPSDANVEHWNLPDPAAVRGRPQDVINSFRAIRNEIEKRVKQLLTGILQGA